MRTYSALKLNFLEQISIGNRLDRGMDLYLAKRLLDHTCVDLTFLFRRWPLWFTSDDQILICRLSHG